MMISNLKGADLIDVNDCLQAVFGNGLWVEPVAVTERGYWYCDVSKRIWDFAGGGQGK